MIFDEAAYDKAMRVVNSVETLEQANTASQYMGLWIEQQSQQHGWNIKTLDIMCVWAHDVCMAMYERVMLS